jgi:hypothetical protein
VVTVNGNAVTVQGTVLEAPANQSAQAGGTNATLTCCATTGGNVPGERTVSLSQPLKPGESVAIQWLLGLHQSGNFRFYVNIEAVY